MRRAAALALASALLAACGDDPAQDCPGEPVASFHFTGERRFAGDPAIPFDPAEGYDDCGDALAYPPSIIPFDGVVSAEPASAAGALCTADGTALLGQRSGDHFLVQTSAEGAVLGEACAATCSAGLRLLVEGDVVRADGEPVSFAGVLVEVMSALPGSACGTCALPCAARYLLTGTR